MDISPNRFLERSYARATTRCPKCQSIYVDNQSCESCGYQLAVDLLGEPLGPKSFYYLKRDFDLYFTYFGKTLPMVLRSKDERRRFHLKIERRFSMLLDYLLSDRDGNTSRRRIFWTEMRDLCQELLQMGTSGKKLTDLIEDHPGHQEYRLVSSELINYIVRLRGQCIERDFSSRLRDYKIAGVMRLSSIVLVGFALVVVLLLSLSWYQYFLVK